MDQLKEVDDAPLPQENVEPETTTGSAPTSAPNGDITLAHNTDPPARETEPVDVEPNPDVTGSDLELPVADASDNPLPEANASPLPVCRYPECTDTSVTGLNQNGELCVCVCCVMNSLILWGRVRCIYL